MKTTTKCLEQKIEKAVERLVREHLAACEAAAARAVRAGFERASKAPSKSSQPRSARTPARRRSREELVALEERLYEAIRRQPGETMEVLASAVGSTSRALRRPARRLRHDGRIRSIGQRQYTRYFPMGE